MSESTSSDNKKSLMRMLKAVFTPPEVKTEVDLSLTHGRDISDHLAPDFQKTVDDHKLAKIAAANFHLQREATQYSLNFVYGSMLISILSSLIAIAALIVAIVKG